jgi:hypothetical protein
VVQLSPFVFFFNLVIRFIFSINETSLAKLPRLLKLCFPLLTTNVVGDFVAMGLGEVYTKVKG